VIDKFLFQNLCYLLFLYDITEKEKGCSEYSVKGEDVLMKVGFLLINPYEGLLNSSRTAASADNTL
jgi:hypothetical protein